MHWQGSHSGTAGAVTCLLQVKPGVFGLLQCPSMQQAEPEVPSYRLCPKGWIQSTEVAGMPAWATGKLERSQAQLTGNLDRRRPEKLEHVVMRPSYFYLVLSGNGRWLGTMTLVSFSLLITTVADVAPTAGSSWVGWNLNRGSWSSWSVVRPGSAEVFGASGLWTCSTLPCVPWCHWWGLLCPCRYLATTPSHGTFVWHVGCPGGPHAPSRAPIHEGLAEHCWAWWYHPPGGAAAPLTLHQRERGCSVAVVWLTWLWRRSEAGEWQK